MPPHPHLPASPGSLLYRTQRAEPCPDSSLFRVGVVPFEKNVYKVSMSQILDAIRLGIWEELATIEAKRYGARRVFIPNIPESAFFDLTRKLTTIASRESNVKGDINWKHMLGKETKGVYNEKSAITLTTYEPVAYLASLGRVQDMELSPLAASGSEALRIHPSGDITFVALPMNLEGVKKVKNGIEQFGLYVGFGIGVIPNCHGPPLRHPSGYESFADGEDLPDYKIWPCLPPYASYIKYAKYNIGNMVIRAVPAMLEAGAVRKLAEPIAEQAQLWAAEENKPEMVDRQFWHHPNLQESHMGTGYPDHQEEAQRRKAEKQKAIIYCRDTRVQLKTIEKYIKYDLKTASKQAKYEWTGMLQTRQTRVLQV